MGPLEGRRSAILVDTLTCRHPEDPMAVRVAHDRIQRELETPPPIGVDIPPLLLTVPEAARLLAIGRSALYQLIWVKAITPVRIGRSVRFTFAELERFVAERAAAAASVGA